MVNIGPIHPDHFRSTVKTPFHAVQAYAAVAGKGEVTKWHSHSTAQLFHVVHGSLAIDTEAGTYFAPPERAVWLPGGLMHQTRYLRETEVRYMYFGPEVAHRLSQAPRVLQVTTLLRELILAFMAHPRMERLEGPPARLADVILDQLQLLPASPLKLPLPSDVRLKGLCETIAQAPDTPPRLQDAARRCGMSERSFERHMHRETGMTFRAWCRQVKLFKSLELLSEGVPVSEISHLLGYEGPSAFVASFKKAFGVTPGRYFS